MLQNKMHVFGCPFYRTLKYIGLRKGIEQMTFRASLALTKG